MYCTLVVVATIFWPHELPFPLQQVRRKGSPQRMVALLLCVQRVVQPI